ncbi:MAG: hypothetical protein V4722_06650 [Bacteroidota bacterium]
MKTKLRILFAIAVTASARSNAQVTPAQHKAVYIQSLKAGDFNTAIQAANYIVAADSKSGFRDSLAILYYNAGNLNPAYYWAETLLQQKPSDISMLEVKAGCLKNSNNALQAIDAYTSLLKAKPDAVYAYELMNLQYGVQRLIECASVGEQTLQNIKIDSNLVLYYTMDGKKKLQTPLKAGVYNVYGMALSDLKKLPEAEKAFEQALLLDKEYTPARKNLEAVQQLKLAFEKPNEVKKEAAKLNE